MAADRTVVLVDARGRRVAVTGAVIATADTPGEIVEIGDGRVIPGLVDAHVHFPSWALGLRELRLFGHALAGRGARARRGGAEAAPTRWLRGRGWREEDWPEGMSGRRSHALDAVTGDVPTALRAHDGHTLWVNSAALAERIGEGGGVSRRHVERTGCCASRRRGTSSTRRGRFAGRVRSTRCGPRCRVAHAARRDGRARQGRRARRARGRSPRCASAGELTLRVWQSVLHRGLSRIPRNAAKSWGAT